MVLSKLLQHSSAFLEAKEGNLFLPSKEKKSIPHSHVLYEISTLTSLTLIEQHLFVQAEELIPLDLQAKQDKVIKTNFNPQIAKLHISSPGFSI